jgi:hypothetical protein
VLTSIPPETQLDTFRLHLVRDNKTYRRSSAAALRWIRRGLQHVPATAKIRATNDENDDDYLKKHGSFSAGSAVMASCVGGFTRRLTTLHLAQVRIVSGFLKDLGKNCPVLEVLHMERCDTYVYAFNSPTLRSLAVIGPSSYGTLARPIKIMAPRLTSLRLEEFSYKGWRYCFHEEDGASDPEPLASLTEASIGLTGLYNYDPNRPRWMARKVQFVNFTMCNFLALIPNVTNLHLTGFTVEVCTIPINFKRSSEIFLICI